MNDLTTLSTVIHRLTREHRSSHTDPITGKISYPTEMSLFDQLRLEQESGRRGGVSSGTGSRSPVALSAMTLWSEIRETLNTAHIALTGTDAPKDSPEDKLSMWIKASQQDEDEVALQKCIRVTTAWANAITSLLNPEPAIDLCGSCPACGETHSWTLTDGEYLRNSALNATLTAATCRACDATWPRQEFEKLAASIGQAAAA